MYSSTTLFVVLLTLLKSSTPTLTPVDPLPKNNPIPVDPHPLLPSLGNTCGDAKESYQQQQCCGAAESKVRATVASYVSAPRDAFALSNAQTTSCDLPVLGHSHFPVDRDAFLAARGRAGALVEMQLIVRWAYSSVSLATGAKLFSGGSFSQHASDGSKFDPRDPSSAPRDYYISDYYPTSKAAYDAMAWYMSEMSRHGYMRGARDTHLMQVLTRPDSRARIVFVGMCKHYADKLQRVFDEFGVMQLYGASIDFALPGASMMARPEVGVNGVQTIDLGAPGTLAAVGIRPTNWTLPA